MNSENRPQFDHDLAEANQPEEFENEQVDTLNEPAQSLNRGLITLYKRHLSLIDGRRQAGLIDRAKADKLTNDVLSLAEGDGVRNEIKYTSTEKAKEIMGAESYFGPQEVRKAGLEIKEEIPLIPFSPKELEVAKEHGQMLIYRTSMTMKELNDTIAPILKMQRRKTKLLYDTHEYAQESIYNSDKIVSGWCLVSKNVNHGTARKDYFDQSNLIAAYLTEGIFNGKPLPPEYQAAVDELELQTEYIIDQLSSDDRFSVAKVGEDIANLKINQLFRQTPAEAAYDDLIYYQNTGHRLYTGRGIWTSSLIGVCPVLIDWAGDGGIRVMWHLADRKFSSIGYAFCRRGADLKS